MTSECIVTMKGNTIIDIKNNAKGFPVVDHQKYRANRAPMTKVSRFVGLDRFIWF